MSGSVCRRKDFSKASRSLCDKYGALLIFDEVKTGAKLMLGRGFGILWRGPGHDLPGEVDWWRVSAGGFRGA